jgi:hypothetical protein
VLDQLGAAAIAEAGRGAIEQRDRLVRGAHQQRAGIRADQPPRRTR